MLTTLFKGILSSSVSTAPVVVGLLLSATFLRRRYSARLCHILWTATAIRLCVPLSVQSLVKVTIPAGSAVYYLEADAAAVARAFAEAEMLPHYTEPAVGQPSAITSMGVLAMVWGIGAGLYLAVQIGTHWMTRIRLGRWNKTEHHPATLHLFCQMKDVLGIKGKIGLYRNAQVCTPMLMGYVRPRILLPDREITATDLQHILLHELQHYRRGDLWHRLLMLIVSAVYWFHPLVRMVIKNAALDMELACDSDVLRNKGKTSRREYGMTMLAFTVPAAGPVPLSTGFVGESGEMKQRIANITKDSPEKRGPAILLLTVCMLIASIALVGCAPLIKSSDVDTGRTQVESPVSGQQDNREPTQQDVSAEREQTSEAYIVVQEEPLGGKKQQAESPRPTVKIYSVDTAAPYIWPAPGYYAISSGFGSRFGGSDYHTGIDIGGEEIYGAEIIATADGTVRFINQDYVDSEPGVGYGMYVLIDHGSGITSLYAQLSEIAVDTGDSVKKGQVIGLVGATGFSTGPHLHFEIRKDGVAVDPADYILTE